MPTAKRIIGSGRPTGLPWGIHAPGTVPQCPGCATGAAMHPSFAYEIAFQLAACAAGQSAA